MNDIEKVKGKMNKFKLSAAIFIIAAGIGLTLFAHWEPTAESWICWFLARIFGETGKFIIVERGPLYVLYLNLFRWIGYPASVTVEYIATSLILTFSLIVLLRRYMGLFWSAFAVFLWLPFFQFAEPPTQKLALALSCLAIVLRDMKVTRFKLASFYALLGLACMLRSTYVAFLLIFAIYDSVKIIGQKKINGFFAVIRPRMHDWPILVVIILFLWFNLMQSPHKWNNAQGTSGEWFPYSGKTLTDAAFIHHYNTMYILQKYGSYKDKDFYFTNQELFNGASTALGAIRANPRFVARQLLQNNIKGTIGLAVNFTMLPRLYKQLSRWRYFYYPIALFLILFFMFAIFYSICRAYKNRNLFLFFIAHSALYGHCCHKLP